MVDIGSIASTQNTNPKITVKVKTTPTTTTTKTIPLYGPQTKEYYDNIVTTSTGGTYNKNTGVYTTKEGLSMSVAPDKVESLITQDASSTSSAKTTIKTPIIYSPASSTSSAKTTETKPIFQTAMEKSSDLVFGTVLGLNRGEKSREIIKKEVLKTEAGQKLAENLAGIASIPAQFGKGAVESLSTQEEKKILEKAKQNKEAYLRAQQIAYEAHEEYYSTKAKENYGDIGSIVGSFAIASPGSTAVPFLNIKGLPSQEEGRLYIQTRIMQQLAKDYPNLTIAEKRTLSKRVSEITGIGTALGETAATVGMSELAGELSGARAVKASETFLGKTKFITNLEIKKPATASFLKSYPGFAVGGYTEGTATYYVTKGSRNQPVSLEEGNVWGIAGAVFAPIPGGFIRSASKLPKKNLASSLVRSSGKIVKYAVDIADPGEAPADYIAAKLPSILSKSSKTISKGTQKIRTVVVNPFNNLFSSTPQKENQREITKSKNVVINRFTNNIPDKVPDTTEPIPDKVPDQTFSEESNFMSLATEVREKTKEETFSDVTKNVTKTNVPVSVFPAGLGGLPLPFPSVGGTGEKGGKQGKNLFYKNELLAAKKAISSVAGIQKDIPYLVKKNISKKTKQTQKIPKVIQPFILFKKRI